MGRKPDPLTGYRVRWHNDKGYRYAYVQRVETKSEEGGTGESKRRKILLGTLTEDFVFIPNKEFRLIDVKERRRYIYPEGWDISAALKLDNDRMASESSENQDTQTGEEKKQVTSSESPEGLPAENQTQSATIPTDNPALEEKERTQRICYSCKIYGEIWLYEQIAKKRGVTDDLIDIFDGDLGAVNDVLTMAIYAIVEDRSFSRLARWQATHKCPADHLLTSDYITRMTQSITENHRMNFIKKRIGRQPKGAIGSVDSTTRSGYGKCLVDLKWGNNKDTSDLQCSLEVVVYSLTTHEPIYYRRFPGNTSDMVTIRTILADLKELGVQPEDLSFMTDRGYCSKENMGNLHHENFPFLMCAKVGQVPVINILERVEYNEFGVPSGLEHDEASELFHGQSDAEPFDILLENGEPYTVKDLKVNIYMNRKKRTDDLFRLHQKIQREEQLIGNMENGTVPFPPLKRLQKQLLYHTVREEEGKYFFSSNENTRKKAVAQCGYFASCMHRLNLNSIEAYHYYKDRDEHEKGFFGLKDDEGADMQDCSSEEGQMGRGLVYFVGLILVTTLRSAWKTKLKGRFRTSYEVLDCMEPIRYSEYISGTDHMTTFNDDQVAICKACDIEPPVECLTSTAREQWRKATKPKKRGRKPGSKNKKTF